ncbi:MAG: recombinase family protein [Candidatus Eisenbacteria bacterium]|nr:recombinase family protein [Candidatus Eisenbacteria bacterium]
MYRLSTVPTPVPRYLLYARKSSESEDRQALSIESQVRELREYARSHNLEIAGVLSESRSAKTPGRPVFADLMRRLAAKEASGILCWKLDRLARNPVDGGALIWAVDQEVVTEIVVPGKSFSNRGDDKFWMQLEFGMAKKYVDDLSDNVKRGNRAKLERGWFPGRPPLGYLNDRARRTIIVDPERFPIVQRIFRSVLAGEVPQQVYNRATQDWGFVARRIGARGGAELARSAFYRLLSNPFYYGSIVRNGESFPGAHPPMISKEEFDRVQEILGRPSRPRRRHEFAFTGLIRRGECGAAITAEAQVNRYGYHYEYYRCTKRKKGVRCGQRPIRAGRLEAQVASFLSAIALPDAHQDWALRHLAGLAADEVRGRESKLPALERAHALARSRSDELVELRLRGLLTDGEFLAKKALLTTEELRARERLAHAKTTRGPVWFEPSRNAVIFANQAPKRFAGASLAEKREIVMALGSNLTLTDRILRIQAEEPFTIVTGKAAGPSWCTQRDARRTLQGWKVWFSEHPTRVQWPAFCREWWERWQRGPRSSKDARCLPPSRAA